MQCSNTLVLTAAIERGIKNVGFTEFGVEAKDLLLEAKKRFKMAREEATKAFNNEALDTLQRITAIRYRVMAAMFESVAKSLAATTDLSCLSRESALQSARSECEQSLQQLHSLPNVKKNFEVALRSGLFNIRGRFGRDERREIICAVCQVNRFIHDAQEFDFDHCDWAAIQIGEKSVSPLYSREVAEALDEAGMQHCCVRMEWSFGQNGEGYRLKWPSTIATNTYGEFLVVGDHDTTISVFDSRGEFIYKINPQLDATYRRYHIREVATDVNNNTYIMVCMKNSEIINKKFDGIFGPIMPYDTCEVQVFTKTELCNKFPVIGDWSSHLTVGHDRVFVSRWELIDVYALGDGSSRHDRMFQSGSIVIDVYELNGTHVCSFESGIPSDLIDIAAGSDGQLFVLECNPTDGKIAHVFTKDGHQQNNFRVDNKKDDYSCLASYPSGEHIVFSGFERKTRRLKVAMYRKDGVFNRSVTLGDRLFESTYRTTGISVTDDGSVAVSFFNKEMQGKVIVRPMKPCRSYYS